MFAAGWSIGWVRWTISLQLNHPLFEFSSKQPWNQSLKCEKKNGSVSDLLEDIYKQCSEPYFLLVTHIVSICLLYNDRTWAILKLDWGYKKWYLQMNSPSHFYQTKHCGFVVKFLCCRRMQANCKGKDLGLNSIRKCHQFKGIDLLFIHEECTQLKAKCRTMQ